MANEIPVACNLSSADLRKREATILARFKAMVTASQELSEGYEFHLPGHKDTLALVAELVSAERECCPFLSFELICQANLGPLVLRVKGPDGAKDFVKSILT